MKIGGVSVTPPSEEMFVLPRGDSHLVFRVRSLRDMDEFNALVPEPTPPGVLTKDGWVPDPNDANYKTVMENYALQRAGFMVIRALEPSKIEWDTVDPNNPKTWKNWEDDFRNSGLTNAEINKVFAVVVDANTINEAKLKAAREVFLRGQAPASPKSTGLHTEQANTPSGEPAPVSA